MRLSLTVKFVIGSLVVAGATALVPELVRKFDIEFWSGGTLFVSLGVGGGIVFFMSRMMVTKFD